jgi:hypothetical protein
VQLNFFIYPHPSSVPVLFSYVIVLVFKFVGNWRPRGAIPRIVLNVLKCLPLFRSASPVSWPSRRQHCLQVKYEGLVKKENVLQLLTDRAFYVETIFCPVSNSLGN